MWSNLVQFGIIIVFRLIVVRELELIGIINVQLIVVLSLELMCSCLSAWYYYHVQLVVVREHMELIGPWYYYHIQLIVVRLGATFTGSNYYHVQLIVVCELGMSCMMFSLELLSCSADSCL